MFRITISQLMMMVHLCMNSMAISTNISIQIFNQSQQIDIDLQRYFEQPQQIALDQNMSTIGIKDIFNLGMQQVPIFQTFKIKMEVTDVIQNKSEVVRLCDHQIRNTQSIHDQPIKIFLLDDNYIMMLIYIEHCRDRVGENKVIGFNISRNILPKQQLKDLSCTDMETHIRTNDSYLLVSCRYTNKKKTYFVIVPIVFITDSAGFITNMSLASNIVPYYAQTNSWCSRFSLKTIQNLIVGNQTHFGSYVYVYCRETKSNSTYQIYLFDGPTKKPKIVDDQLTNCLVNASFIETHESGFFVITDSRQMEYYNNYSGHGPKCEKSDYEVSEYVFATSRNFKGEIQSFIFLDNKQIVIKSTYRKNHQSIPVSYQGYSYSSFALNQHFLGLAMIDVDSQNGTTYKVVIINLDNFVPKKVATYEFSTELEDDLTLFSAKNYLQSGFYYFQYTNSTNTLSLNQYFGNYLKLSVKEKNVSNFYFQSQHQKQENYQIVYYSKKKQSERLIINVIVRDFYNNTIYQLPTQQLKITEPFININLFNYTHGPLQRYFRGPINKNESKQIQYDFVNYYNEINISQYLTASFKDRKQEKLKTIAINNKLKISEPPIKLFYSSFFVTCSLITKSYHRTFEIMCDNEDRQQIKTMFVTEFDIVVIESDKWLQFNGTFLEMCKAISDETICSSIEFRAIGIKSIITNIKIVGYKSDNMNQIREIQLFLISDKYLYFGLLINTYKNSFVYLDNFILCEDEVEQLKQNNISDIEFDQGYNNFLFLHLQGNSTLLKLLLIFDRPETSISSKFIGHLITKFNTVGVEKFMMVDNLIIIVELTDDEEGKVTERSISNSYQITQTRNYPLYDNAVKAQGKHFTDGQFVYVQVISDNQKHKYLVYCPSQLSANLLTHILYAQQADIHFLQNIGMSSSNYPHSIGILDDRLFALSTPNIVLKLNRNQYQANKDYNEGNISLGLLDFNNKLNQIAIGYKLDVSEQRINYNEPQEKSIEVNNSTRFIIHSLNSSKIIGSVMSYNISLKSEECIFLESNMIEKDVFSKKRCLLNNDLYRYGKILDFITVQAAQNLTLDLIITQRYLLCVENKTNIIHNQEKSTSKACTITNIEQSQALIVCDKGQSSQIRYYSLDNKCHLDSIENVKKPKWLTYRYFNIQYAAPFIVFQIPVRYDQAKIYYITSFNDSELEFNQKALKVIVNTSETETRDYFISKDFSMDFEYLYLLENGLGIYDLNHQKQIENKSDSIIPISPIIWIPQSQLKDSLKTEQELVYVHTIIEIPKKFTEQTDVKYLEIGTSTLAYRIKVDIKYSEGGDYSYKISRKVIYHQQKNCQNTIISKSKSWGGNLIKQCTLVQKQFDIFSNFIPISETSKKKYLQVYKIQDQQDLTDDLVKEHYPFRMEPVTTDNSFQINQNTSELIVSSLINFLCYYDLAPIISWRFTMVEDRPKLLEMNNYICQFQVNMFNSHDNTTYSFQIEYIPEDYSSNSIYIFRSFFLFLVFIFCYQTWQQSKKKKLTRKLRRFSTNIYSNQFQIQVKMNTKRSFSKMFEEKESEIAIQ